MVSGFKEKNLKRCAVCGGFLGKFVKKSNMISGIIYHYRCHRCNHYTGVNYILGYNFEETERDVYGSH